MMKRLIKILLILTIISAGIIRILSNKPLPTFETVPLLPTNDTNFAVFSDIHANYKNLEKALVMTESEQAEFIVITGDLTTVGNKSELLKVKNILDKTSLNYYAIPGNHDLYLGRKIEANIWEEVFGADYQSFEKNNQKFILINNADDYFGMNDKQWQWLEIELQECPQITCLVFMHEPLNHPNSTHIMGETSPAIASQAARLVMMLVNNQVKEVFAGHLHFSSTYEINRLKTTIVGALTDDRNPQMPRFLEVFGEERKEQVISD